MTGFGEQLSLAKFQSEACIEWDANSVFQVSAFPQLKQEDAYFKEVAIRD